MQQAHNQFRNTSEELKGEIDRRRGVLRPNAAQKILHPRSSPLPNVDSTSAKEALKCALLKGCCVPRVVLRLTVLASRDLLLSP